MDNLSSDKDSCNAAITASNTFFNSFIIPVIATVSYDTYFKDLRHTGQPGHVYLQELFDNASKIRFIEVMRMSKQCFWALHNELTLHAGLVHNRYIDSVQKLCIFLHCLKGDSNRKLQETFQHSGDTISATIHNVASVVIRYKSHLISLPTLETPHEIESNTKFYPYFKNCIGALDGTHIRTVVPKSIERAFRNRKGFLSQNVLACCGFNMQFTYVLAGWEGSAHDGRVLADAYDKGFTIPDGKFYLGDAGYGLSTKVLTPYRGV